IVTTRRRLMPQGTSFSFLQAVTQALHSMQRSASQRNFMRATAWASLPCSDLTEGGLGLLPARDGIETVGGGRGDAIRQANRVVALGIFAALIDALEPAREVVRAPDETPADALRHQCLHARPGIALRACHPHPAAVPDAALGGIGGVDLDEHVLAQLRQPLVG